MARVVLLQPPYFKLLGSHNDKVVPSLMFLGNFLSKKGEEVYIVNADATGASWYIPWKELYQNFGYYVEAVEKGSPLFPQTVEQVMTYKPDYVVVSAGCYLAATVDFGSPWVGMKIVDLLRRYKVEVYSYGPLWDEGSFDIFSFREKVGIVYKDGIDLSLLPAGSKYDVVFTSVGCPYSCKFCLQPKYVKGRIRLNMDALLSQLHLNTHYIEDPVFLPDDGLVEQLRGRKYTVEARVDCVDENWVEKAKNCGVRIVKLGVESGSRDFIKQVDKRIDLDLVKEKMGLIRSAGISVVIYTMLGWPGITEKDYWEGLSYLKELDGDYYVINLTNVYGQNGRDWRFDTHFSPVVARYWGLSDALVYAYFSLQEGKKNPTLL
ncbi:MAG: radical SAM protein [Candidatus Bathyarchaeia archaeon]